MMPPAYDTAEHIQVTAADCQQKNTKSADNMAKMLSARRLYFGTQAASNVSSK